MTKANTLGSLPGSLASVAFSGAYSDLSSKPTALSQFTNDAGFLTGVTSTQVTTALGFTPENAANRNVANGYAGLDSSGLISSSLLPSYVDDVLEYANLAAFPGTGTAGKIFVALDTNKTYRWSGSVYVEISASPGSTDAVTEGSVNLYFTNARARAAVSATGSLSYNSSTGVFSYTAPTVLSAFTNDSGFITSSALSPYLLSATAASTYQTQSGMSSYLTTSSAASTYLALAGGTLTGNLAFNGTGLRITGDFSNATFASRTLVQTSTANANTQLGLIPNGTAVNSAFFAYNNADPTNASTAALRVNASEAALISGITGTGTYLPMVFLTSNAERGRFDTSGNFGIGTTSPGFRLDVAGASGVQARFKHSAGGTAQIQSYTGQVEFTSPDASVIYGSGSATGLVSFYAGGSERARFTTGGDFGIGLSPNTSQGILQTYKNIGGGAPSTSGSTDANQIVSLGAGSVALTFGAYSNGDGWIQQRSITNFATNYGIGVNPNGGRVFFGGAVQEAKSAISASDINVSASNYFTKTISGATTFTVSSVPATGTAASFILDLTNGGAGTITWWSGVKWAGGTAPTLTSSGRDVLGFYTHDGGTTWTGLVLGKDVK